MGAIKLYVQGKAEQTEALKQTKSRLAALEAQLKAAKAAAGTDLLATTASSTAADSKVQDLEGKIKAAKREEAAIKMYVQGGEEQTEALKQTKSRLAALEAQLKAA